MSSAELLKSFFDLKKEKNSKYSLRAMARDLDISAAYLSRILSGKQSFPLRRLRDFIKILNIDLTGERELIDLLVKEQDIASELKDFYLKTPNDKIKKTNPSSKYQKLSTKSKFLLSEWYFIAILDLSTCKVFKDDPSWIAKRLSLPVETAEAALTKLKESGFLELEDGVWTKSINKLRFPVSQTAKSSRDYRLKMLHQAELSLKQNTKTNKTLSPLTTSVTLAVNSSKIKLANERIDQAIYEVIDILTEGECDEVYHLFTSFFPLSKS